MPPRVVPTKEPQPLRPRHIPKRTCVACRVVQEKRGLQRIVRGADGIVRVDATGKLPGRGVYLHTDPECWREGLRKGRLSRALRTTLSPEDLAALEAFGAQRMEDISREHEEPSS